MPYLQKKEIPPGKLKIPKATNACYGDLYCPSCGCWIVTPDSVFIVPGTGRCPRCRKSFKVTKEAALQSNRQQEKAIRKDLCTCQQY